MSLRSASKLILAKLEAVYGVAETLGGTDALYTMNASLSPLEGSTTPVNQDRSSFGNDVQLHSGTHVKFEFDVPLIGSGTLGTAPGWGDLLKACQWQETIVPSTSVSYGLNSAGTDSLTMAFFMDGQNHSMVGARGSADIKFDSQQIPMLHFMFLGMWVDPASEAAPAPTGWGDFVVPHELVTNANTPTAQFYGNDVVLKSLKITQGNQVNHYDDPNEESVQILDRAMGGSINIIAPALSDTNYFTTARANTTGTLTVHQGTAAGEVVKVAAPAGVVQILQPNYGDDNGRATLQANLSLVPTSAEDDELTITLDA